MAEVKIEVGLPPKVYDWLLLNSTDFVADQKDRLPLEKRVVQNKTYRVLSSPHANLTSFLLCRPVWIRGSDASVVRSWFDAIEPVLRKIGWMDDVVSLAPWCAKLVVAPEKKNCAWRKRKT